MTWTDFELKQLKYTPEFTVASAWQSGHSGQGGATLVKHNKATISDV